MDFYQYEQQLAERETAEAAAREDETFVPVGAPYKAFPTSYMLFQPALDMWREADEKWAAGGKAKYEDAMECAKVAEKTHKAVKGYTKEQWLAYATEAKLECSGRYITFHVNFSCNACIISHLLKR